MQQKTHLAHGVEKTQFESEYDEKAKDLLSDKQVLAWIVKYTTLEFRDYDIPTIMECIEGEPEVSKKSVYPGKGNTEVITGMNTESKIPNEGEITFDIRFHATTPDKEQVKIILNVEAQKQFYLQYHFEPRGIVYLARMISEQVDREFTADNYDGLKKVYSIWIFMNAPKKYANTITGYEMTKKDIYGSPVEGGKYDYLSMAFIRLPKGNKKKSGNKLIEMLSVLLSNELDADTKKTTLENDYNMKMTRKLEGGLSMCNLSLGIREEGIAIGDARGICKLVETCQEFGRTKEEAIQKLIEKYGLSEAEAKQRVKKHWKK